MRMLLSFCLAFALVNCSYCDSAPELAPSTKVEDVDKTATKSKIKKEASKAKKATPTP